MFKIRELSNGYTVRSDGRIFRPTRVEQRSKTTTRIRKGGWCKPRLTGHLYLKVTINRQSRYVHRLVAEAFVPNPKNLPEVNHKDGDKLNNLPDNLEWCTHAENIRHAKLNGLFDTEKQRNSRKIHEEHRLEIKKLYGSGNYTQEKLGQMFGCTQAHIGRIVRGIR